MPTGFRSNPNTQGAATEVLHDLAIEQLPRRQRSGINFEKVRGASNELFSITLRDIEAHSNHPFHGVDHAFETSETFQLLIALLADPITTLDEMLGLFACGAHDLRHSGFRYRQLSEVPNSEHQSNEEFAAATFDSLISTHPDLDVIGAKERLKIQGAILATSVGQLKPPTKDLFRPYKPHSKLETLVFLSDRLRFINSIEGHLKASITYVAELSPKERPSSFKEWLCAETEYCEYLASIARSYIYMFSKRGQQKVLKAVSKLGEVMAEVATNGSARNRSVQRAFEIAVS